MRKLLDIIKEIGLRKKGRGFLLSELGIGKSESELLGRVEKLKTDKMVESVGLLHGDQMDSRIPLEVSFKKSIFLKELDTFLERYGFPAPYSTRTYGYNFTGFVYRYSPEGLGVSITFSPVCEAIISNHRD